VIFLCWYGKLAENDTLATAPDCTGNPFYSSFFGRIKRLEGKAGRNMIDGRMVIRPNYLNVDVNA
jgi:hypothetical protein